MSQPPSTPMSSVYIFKFALNGASNVEVILARQDVKLGILNANKWVESVALGEWYFFILM